MTDEQTKQAILGFTEFFKGITGNQNLEIPSEIAEKCGIQAQADDDILDTFRDKGKQKVFHISDTDITFAEEINYEEAQRRCAYAMNHIGVVAVRGGI